MCHPCHSCHHTFIHFIYCNHVSVTVRFAHWFLCVYAQCLFKFPTTKTIKQKIIMWLILRSMHCACRWWLCMSNALEIDSQHSFSSGIHNVRKSSNQFTAILCVPSVPYFTHGQCLCSHSHVRICEYPFLSLLMYLDFSFWQCLSCHKAFVSTFRC